MCPTQDYECMMDRNIHRLQKLWSGLRRTETYITYCTIVCWIYSSCFYTVDVSMPENLAENGKTANTVPVLHGYRFLKTLCVMPLHPRKFKLSQQTWKQTWMQRQKSCGGMNHLMNLRWILMFLKVTQFHGSSWVKSIGQLMMMSHRHVLLTFLTPNLSFDMNVGLNVTNELLSGPL